MKDGLRQPTPTASASHAISTHKRERNVKQNSRRNEGGDQGGDQGGEGEKKTGSECVTKEGDHIFRHSRNGSPFNIWDAVDIQRITCLYFFYLRIHSHPRLNIAIHKLNDQYHVGKIAYLLLWYLMAAICLVLLFLLFFLLLQTYVATPFIYLF